jgi:hypothetical protein
MNKLFPLALLCLTCLSILPSVIRAQSRDESIQSSWDRAAREKNPTVQPQTQEPNIFLRREGDQYPDWDKRKASEAKAWPAQAKVGAPRDYQTANTQLIDSLSSLYCLSSNYIAMLRHRNESVRPAAPSAPPLREFTYTAPQGQETTRKPASGQESPDALNRELLQLLERCLSNK